jgi:hypothetical protein
MKRKKKEKLIITNTFKKLGDRGEKKGAGRKRNDPSLVCPYE